MMKRICVIAILLFAIQTNGQKAGNLNQLIDQYDDKEAKGILAAVHN